MFPAASVAVNVKVCAPSLVGKGRLVPVVMPGVPSRVYVMVAVSLNVTAAGGALVSAGGAAVVTEGVIVSTVQA